MIFPQYCGQERKDQLRKVWIMYKCRFVFIPSFAPSPKANRKQNESKTKAKRKKKRKKE